MRRETRWHNRAPSPPASAVRPCRRGADRAAVVFPGLVPLSDTMRPRSRPSAQCPSSRPRSPSSTASSSAADRAPARAWHDAAAQRHGGGQQPRASSRNGAIRHGRHSLRCCRRSTEQSIEIVRHCDGGKGTVKDEPDTLPMRSSQPHRNRARPRRNGCFCLHHHGALWNVSRARRLSPLAALRPPIELNDRRSRNSRTTSAYTIALKLPWPVPGTSGSIPSVDPQC